MEQKNIWEEEYLVISPLKGLIEDQTKKDNLSVWPVLRYKM